MESPRKRKANLELVSNPFIKKRNLEWRISPPPFRDPECRRRQEADGVGSSCGSGDGGEARRDNSKGAEDDPAGEIQEHQTAAADTAHNSDIEGGRPSESALIENNTVQIEDHLAYFSDLLTRRTLTPYPAGHPRLPIPRYQSLYTRSLGSARGAHFVVTQHDHPVAGPHYDLRLQINETSSCSWAIMYGLPGDPNSRGRSGVRNGAGVLRNATETRVHCLWNHLVETAGPQTGSLMVWDAGGYEVLPRRSKYAPLDSSQEAGGSDERWGDMTQQEKLAGAFAARKIRLRLNGTRLPRGYVVNLRLTREEDAAGRARAAGSGGPRRSRRVRGRRGKPARGGPETSSDSDDGRGVGRDGKIGDEEEEYNDGSLTAKAAAEGISEMEKELRELEDEQVRRTNAYTGAVNTIGSVHQRKWFLSLDREACGFERSRKEGKVWWERVKGGRGCDDDGNDEDDGNHRYKWPFYVRGPDYERSVVTGRLGADILKDEGVVGYYSAAGWGSDTAVAVADADIAAAVVAGGNEAWAGPSCWDWQK
ncbi:hypothetical protein VMCG_03547 [Cytospora schulzeri]|uniref:DNA ligase D 3'-phosphoesterase domain-containing protein n=1 Tax=Cytospora schulzeri TaxID=448051 RepID=A0A423WW62_9PEZI|nr:hypothetical protein VMCG_03547 [Valsa malicola]